MPVTIDTPAIKKAAETLRNARKSGAQYLNPVHTQVGGPGLIFRSIARLLTSNAETVPKKPLGPFQTDASLFEAEPLTGLRVTWMGHSTALIEVDGCRILTDPVWSERASPVQFAGPKRFFAPTLNIADLPRLDAVIVSHDHYDHLDKAAIAAMAKLDTRFYCSLGVGRYLRQWGVAAEKITELDWTQSAEIAKGCTLTATPTRHFSGRSMWNRYQTLWSSFVIRGPKHTVFYGADSGWFEGFAEIGRQYGPFDLTMLEVGAYDPDWASIHLGPDRAADAHLALRGRQMMPIHWGLFNLAFHDWWQPVERLQEVAAEKGISLFLPEPGAPAEVGELLLDTQLWRRHR